MCIFRKIYLSTISTVIAASLLAGLTLVTVADGYMSGAPLAACVDMFPEGHGVDAQSSTAPFDIKISQNMYQPKEKIGVFISSWSGYYFKGIFLQARLANCTNGLGDTPVGTFQLKKKENYLKTLRCNEHENTSVTHQGIESETFKELVWIAPPTAMGPIYLRATVVQEKEMFWTDIFSPFIRDVSNFADHGTSCIPRTKKPSGLKAKSNSGALGLQIWILVFALLLTVFEINNS